MLKTMRRLPEVQNVGPGKTATVPLPLGRRYHVVWLQITCNAVALASTLNDLRVMVNGVAQRTHSYAELNGLNTLMGSIYGSATLSGSTGASNLVATVPIFFAEPWRTEYAVIDGLAWNLVARGATTPNGITSATIEIDIASGASATVGVLAYAEWDAPTANELGDILKWTRTDLPVTGTTATWDQLPKVAGQRYQQLSFVDSNITSLKFDIDGVVLQDEFITKLRHDQILTCRGMTPVSTRWDQVFDYEDLPSSVLNIAGAQNAAIYAVLADGTARSIRTLLGQWGPMITG